MSRTGERAFAFHSANRLQIVGACPECVVGHIRGVVILLWREEVVVAGARWVRDAMRTCLEQHPSGIAFLTVIERGCSLSTSSDVREELAALLRRHERSLLGAAITFEGEGFKATMVRSVITAVNLASRARFPNSVLSDMETAAAWIATHAPTPISPEVLTDAVDTLRTA